MRIDPNTRLNPGTKIQVQQKRGKVVNSRVERDQFGDPIVVHIVCLTERLVYRIGGNEVWKPLKRPVTKQCNYSFIIVLD